MIKLYTDEPFNFVKFLTGVPVTISNGTKNFNLSSNEKGVFELWDVAPGLYEITPNLPEGYVVHFPLSMGDIEFKEISKVQVDTDVFKVRIGRELCGGADYVVYAR